MLLPDIPDTHKGLMPEFAYPHNIEAEQSILGALLIDNKLMEHVESILDPSLFYDPLHGQIYETIGSFIHSGKLATPITLRTLFETSEPISSTLTVPQYLGRLVVASSSILPAALKSYAQVVADLAARRRIILVAQEMIVRASDAPADEPAHAIVEQAERGLFEIVEKRVEGREVSLSDAVGTAIERIATAYERGGELCGVPTGLIDLDKLLGGLQPSDLIILGGRPAMGKTALATAIAYDLASHGSHVHFFSQEMSPDQIAMRIIGEQASISSDLLRRGQVTEIQFRDVMGRADVIKRAAFTIDDTGGITLGALAAKARRTKRRCDTKLIVVDYLQLMSGAGKSSDNRVQEITKITMGLKALAKELDVPILALSQLSRKVEERADKRPQMADLRESGSIEQDADVVMFVFREEYYLDREKPDEADPAQYTDWTKRMQRCHGKAEVIVGKHRHGPVGTVQLSFEGAYTRFGNLALGGYDGR